MILLNGIAKKKDGKVLWRRGSERRRQTAKDETVKLVDGWFEKNAKKTKRKGINGTRSSEEQGKNRQEQKKKPRINDSKENRKGEARRRGKELGLVIHIHTILTAKGAVGKQGGRDEEQRERRRKDHLHHWPSDLHNQ